MKSKILFLALAVVLILTSALPTQAQTATYYTSTSVAVSQTALSFTVASTTNLTASTQTSTVYGVLSDGIGGAELVKINTVNTSTKVIGVTRGQGGIQTPHVSGAIFFFGPGGDAAQGNATPFTNTTLQEGSTCTATQYPFLPIVNYQTGTVWNCSGSRWVNGSGGVSPIADAAYTATLGDYIIEFTSLTAARTVTLPTPVAGMRGKIFIVKNTSLSGTNTIWISGLKQSGAIVDSLLCYAAVATNCAGPTTVVQGAVVAPAATAFPAGRYYTNGTSWYAW